MLFCVQVPLAGCTATPSLPPPQAALDIEHGTILAVRPIGALPSGEVSQVIAGLAGVPAFATTPLCEYIVRVGDGRLISVVQTPAPAFTPGQDVAIIRGGQTRLQPV